MHTDFAVQRMNRHPCVGMVLFHLRLRPHEHQTIRKSGYFASVFELRSGSPTPRVFFPKAAEVCWSP
jgi:hypothetical protein